MTGEPPPDAAAEIERFAAELLNQPISELLRQIRRLTKGQENVMGERTAQSCRHDDPMTLVTAADGCSLQCERCGQIVVPVKRVAIYALEVALLKARDATDGWGQKLMLSTHSARAAAAQMARLAQGFERGGAFSDSDAALAALRNIRLLLDVMDAFVEIQGELK